jgi:hypothetical protein
VGDQMATVAEVMVLVGDMGSDEEKQRNKVNFLS